MNQHRKFIKKTYGEVFVTSNIPTSQKYRWHPSEKIIFMAICLIIGMIAYWCMVEVNFSAFLPSPIKQTLFENSKYQNSAKEVLFVYLGTVISQPKNLRLCHDYPDENIFEC